MLRIGDSAFTPNGNEPGSIGFLHHQAAPHGGEQPVLGDDLPRPPRQLAEHAEGPRAQRHVDAVAQQQPFAGQQRERAEAQFGHGHGGRH